MSEEIQDEDGPKGEAAPAEEAAPEASPAENESELVLEEHEKSHENVDDPDQMEFRSARDLDAMYDIPVQVAAVLGKSEMQVSQLLKLGRGAVVELDRKIGEAIDIYVNNRLVARGEVVVVEDRLGVTMTEIIKADRS